MVPIKGDKNLCEEVEKGAKDPDVQKRLKEQNINPSCPIKAVSIVQKTARAGWDSIDVSVAVVFDYVKKCVSFVM